MNRKWIALCGGLGAVAFATWLSMAEAATTPFGVAPPPEQGGSPIGGPLSPLFMWIAFAQQHFYGDLVERMADIKANPVALWALLGLSFLYGVFHAAGPGHGKAVISGYLVASGESVRRGIVLSFAAAFVQALSAILVVGIAGAILHVTAVTMTAATGWFEVASSGLIAAVGAWLLWNKTFGGHTHAHFHGPVPAEATAGHGHRHGHGDHDRGHGHDHTHAIEHHEGDHGHEHHEGDHAHRHDRPTGGEHVHASTDHSHGHDHHDGGHVHDHDFAAIAKAAAPGKRPPFMRAWSAIFAVGVRPCSGALIVLVFALAQGLFLAGVAATLVMAIGTGLTVAILATIAVSARGLAVRIAGADSPRTERLVHAAEIGVAALVLVFGLLLLGGSLVNGIPGSS